MGYQDDYVMRTISDLVRAIARLALGKNEINYALPDTEDKYSDTDRIYRKLRDLVDAGEINEAENQLYENLSQLLHPAPDQGICKDYQQQSCQLLF